nr:hypothetical protein [uncultured bacterium]AQS31135.1 hypothetical protein [uncultured bacterium]
MGKSKTVLLLVGLFTVIALAGVSCSRGLQTTDNAVDNTLDNTVADNAVVDNTAVINPTNQTTTTVSSSGLPDPASVKASLATETSGAETAVKTLQADAVLQLVSIKFINSLSDQTGLSTNYYIYASASNPNFYYLVNMPRNGEKLKRFLMPVEDLDLPFDLLQIPVKYWKLSYAEALQSVEQRGGSDFRAKHKTFEVSAILAIPAGQYLSWFVTYRATDGTGDVLKASVDANSGAVSLI